MVPFTLALAKSLVIAMPVEKDRFFAKRFAKEWVGYAISLVSIAITKESLFGIAIAKLSVNGP